MILTELTASVEMITDTDGKPKAVLDWQVWQEIVTLLEQYFQPKTERGHKLWAARTEILAAGFPVLNREELAQELAERRGGVSVS